MPTSRYSFIAAPKERALLAAYGTGAEGLIEFGWFSAVSRVAVGILTAIHVVLPNYGIAILILTGLVRLMLHPLTRKQQIGMIKMQKLQPQIAELQRKYADDKQMQTREQMALFQKYGVHPLSGCGPMLLQLPVLIALYRALGAAIELRHAGFLWISDLSRPDTILHFPISLPLLQDELNVLPVLMAAVMFWQQKSMPTPGSEQAQQQQKMMKWMPLIFVVFFYHMSSGLVLYLDGQQRHRHLRALADQPPGGLHRAEARRRGQASVPRPGRRPQSGRAPRRRRAPHVVGEAAEAGRGEDGLGGPQEEVSAGSRPAEALVVVADGLAGDVGRPPVLQHQRGPLGRARADHGELLLRQPAGP